MLHEALSFSPLVGLQMPSRTIFYTKVSRGMGKQVRESDKECLLTAMNCFL
jgi:hypothetical protein